MAFGRDSPDPVIPNWFIDDITNNLDVGRQTDCLIMDFNKAFDKVSHCLLTHKLDHYGVRGKSNIWIRNFLSNRKQTVVVEGETSDYINVESGNLKVQYLDQAYSCISMICQKTSNLQLDCSPTTPLFT